MPDVRQSSKPNENISSYEWDVTPTPVKNLIAYLQQLAENKQSQIDALQLENQHLREELDLRIEKSYQVASPLFPETILWGMIGFVLTVGSTFIDASTVSFPWLWNSEGVTTQSLGVSLQIGAVLLIGCLGGKNAALLSQLAYLTCGLLGLPIFDRGGGWLYVFEPNFGYLLGFVIGAWICGYFAFQKFATINSLLLSCLSGLLAIHVVGILYLVALNYAHGLPSRIESLSQGIYMYSVVALPGQLAVICGIVTIGFWIRKLMLS